jgi:hypothetical protein
VEELVRVERSPVLRQRLDHVLEKLSQIGQVFVIEEEG